MLGAGAGERGGALTADAVRGARSPRLWQRTGADVVSVYNEHPHLSPLGGLYSRVAAATAAVAAAGAGNNVRVLEGPPRQ